MVDIRYGGTLLKQISLLDNRCAKSSRVWNASYLEIGGLKEKLLAALRGGIKLVLIPEANAKDLQEIPENVKSGLEIVPVRWIDQVLELALVSQPVPLPDEEPVEAVAAVGVVVVDPVAPETLKH